jgi:hypothetical protein
MESRVVPVARPMLGWVAGRTNDLMTTRGRLLFGVPLAFLAFAALAGGKAEAHHGWWARVEVRTYPPPPPVYLPPPQPVVVMEPAPSPWPNFGIGLSGLAVSSAGGAVSTGTAGTLQWRTSAQSLFFLELQSLRADRAWDGLEREDVAGLMGVRLYAWDSFLTPYLDLAAGFGEASFHCCSTRLDAAQFLARYGVGLELRLGRHLAFDAQVAQIHRLRLDVDTGPVVPLDDHERAMEVRGGIAFRF